MSTEITSAKSQGSKPGLIRNLMLATSALVVLAGCSLAPGSHQALGSDTTDESQSLDDQIRLYHVITPALLRQLQQPEVAPEHNVELERARADYDYRVGNGDILTITVWNHPELTIPAGSMRSAAEAGNWVHNDGTIFYPYIGQLKVTGLRVTEIRDMITDKLTAYIEDPQVDVTVAAFRSKRVYVTGEVKQPGTQPVTNVPLTLLDAVNNAGGITEMADWQTVTLTRDNQDYRFSLRDLYQRGDTTQNILLTHGDVVHVERSDVNRVFVLGEVVRPATLNINRYGMSLAEALSEAGGIDENRADARGVFVFRATPEGSEQLVDVFQLNVREAVSYVLAEQFELQPRDIVYVTAAPVTRWNRVISQVLPTISGLYQISRTDREISGR